MIANQVRRERPFEVPMWGRACVALVTIALSIGPSTSAVPLPGQTTAERPAHAFGYVIPVHGGQDDVGVLPVRPQEPADGGDEEGPQPARLWLVLELRWRDAEPRPGELDLEQLDRWLDRLAGDDRPVVLRLDATPPEHLGEASAPGGGDSAVAGPTARRKAWLDFLRAAARTAGPRVTWFLLDGIVSGAPSQKRAERAGYELKSASVTLRAESPGAGIAVGVADAAAEQLLIDAYAAAGDLAPYVDAVAGRSPGSSNAAWPVDTLRVSLFEVDPGVSIWIDERLPGAAAAASHDDELLARGMESVAAGADLVVFRVAGGERPDGHHRRLPLGGPALAGLARALPPDIGVSPLEGAGIALAESSPPASWTRLFDESQFTEILVYWSTDPSARDLNLRWQITKSLRRGYRVFDPVDGTERYVRAEPIDEERVGVTVPLGRRPRLLLISRQKHDPAIDFEDQLADVRTESGVTVEEIVAAHQRWRAFQDDRLRTIRREGRISFRPRFGQFTGTADLTIDGDYFWERETGGEWVIREKYINGVRLNWEEIPQIPLIRWDQVVQAPLDLELDKRYLYELEGEEPVEDRACWRIRFEPLQRQTGESLFRGRAWIDQRTGAVVKVRSVQTGLEAPVLSREETRVYRPYEGPDGTVYWLLDELDGQILQSVAGSNLVILQEWRFGVPDINAPDFGPVRAESYASKKQMLRDTPEGFKWLDRTEEGNRIVREKPQTSQWFAAAGVLKDEGLDGVIPLAGVNYVNLDTFGRGLLFNALLAGPLANVTLSDPSFLDSHWDIGLNLNAIAIEGTDRVFVAGDEIEALRVGRIRQSLSGHAGYPLGDFVKLRGNLGIDYVDYRSDDDTDASLVIPSDHTELSVGVGVAFDRAGWGLGVRAARAVRSDWEPWGGSPGNPLVTGDELDAAQDFSTWALQAQKSWFLRSFQKIEVDATVQGGSDLDRFS
ncbi:MAG: hypothetical protein OEQ13_11225, partial [Acidobacteriota bacterium]|nr:hypothetical protein [Acidobacteriota bacterium]